jgi:hypothetical protein
MQSAWLDPSASLRMVSLPFDSAQGNELVELSSHESNPYIFTIISLNAIPL